MGGIKGIQKTSLVDFSPNIVSTIFFGGCNLRCPYCHNKDLVLDSKALKEIKEEKILDFLVKRKKILDGVCISGGEPTLYAGLTPFIHKVKKLGLKIKLDTNGTNPNKVEVLLKNNLIDYVAIDIKSDKRNYKQATNSNIDVDKIEDTIKLIQKYNIEYELRTTVVPGLFNKEIAERIGEWFGDKCDYYIQQFRPESTLDENFKNIKPFSSDELKEFKIILEKYFRRVGIRD